MSGNVPFSILSLSRVTLCSSNCSNPVMKSCSLILLLISYTLLISHTLEPNSVRKSVFYCPACT